jgi:hypothetical protein
MASALAKVDHFKSQQSSSSSRRISSGLGSATPTEDDLLIIKPNDTTVLSEESDTRAKHKLVAHESAAMVPQVDVMNRWVSKVAPKLGAILITPEFRAMRNFILCMLRWWRIRQMSR